MKNEEHSIRLNYLEKAKNLYLARSITPDFFLNLSLALPESARSIMIHFSSGLKYQDAKYLLERIGGLVIGKHYLTTPPEETGVKGFYEKEKWARKVLESVAEFSKVLI